MQQELDWSLSDTLHELFLHLKEPSAVERAQLGRVGRKAVLALHTDTFFQVQGQPDRVRTEHGSRPGDSYADVVFGYLMSRVLHKFEEALQDAGVLSRFPCSSSIQLHTEPVDLEQQTYEPFVGPCWMDDLAIPLTASSNSELLANLGLASGVLLDLFRAHAMTPNLSAGKTEILMKKRSWNPSSQD